MALLDALTVGGITLAAILLTLLMWDIRQDAKELRARTDRFAEVLHEMAARLPGPPIHVDAPDVQEDDRSASEWATGWETPRSWGTWDR